MEKKEIYKKLNEVFVNVFNTDDISITDETTAQDIADWDSLTHITLIAEIEDCFDIKFMMKEVIGMKNVGEMVDIIEREIC